MRLICLTSNEFCTAADPSDVRRHVKLQLAAAQRPKDDYRTNACKVASSAQTKSFKVLHTGTGSFAKYNKTHHQSDHNYVWTLLDIPTSQTAATEVDQETVRTPPLEVYIACFQEMFVRAYGTSSQRTTAHSLHHVLHKELPHAYKVETSGLVGEANMVTRKRMGMGLYVWSRTPLKTCRAFTSARLHRPSKRSTKRMLQLVLRGSQYTLTLGNVHLPMKENLWLSKKRAIDMTNPMKQQQRNAMLVKALHSMDTKHALTHLHTRRRSRSTRKRARGGRHSRRHSVAQSATPESYTNVLKKSDMMSGTDREGPFALPNLGDWTDIVYRWLVKHPHQAFCPTCEFVRKRPLTAASPDGGWNRVPDIPVRRDPAAWKREAASSVYHTTKHNSYNLPSYCDRILVRVQPNPNGQAGCPHVQVMAGDMNYRLLPIGFLQDIAQQRPQSSL